MNKKIIESSNKFFEYYDKILDSILIALFSSMILLIFLGIIGRSLFNFSIMWSEEFSRYAFIWAIWLGAARAFTLKRHLVVDFLILRIRKQFRIYIEIILYILIIIFLFYIMLEGIKYSRLYWYNYFYSTDFLKLGWAYSIISIACIIMILNILRLILEEYYIRNYKHEGDNK